MHWDILLSTRDSPSGLLWGFSNPRESWQAVAPGTYGVLSSHRLYSLLSFMILDTYINIRCTLSACGPTLTASLHMDAHVHCIPIWIYVLVFVAGYIF